jgi:hypothetical protein
LHDKREPAGVSRPKVRTTTRPPDWRDRVAKDVDEPTAERLIERIKQEICLYRALGADKAIAIKQERYFLKHLPQGPEPAHASRKSSRRVPMYSSAAPYGSAESRRRIKQLSTDKAAERWLINALRIVLEDEFGLPVTAKKHSLLVAILTFELHPLKDSSTQRRIRETLGLRVTRK